MAVIAARVGPHSTLNDHEIVRLMFAGDADAIEYVLVDRCGRTLQYLGRRYGCDDLLAQLYLLLSEDNWRRLRSWSGEGGLTGWIRAVALRICLGELKEKARLHPLEDGMEVKDTKRTPSRLRRKMDIDRMMGAVALLKKREQAVLILCEFEGWSAEDAASMLGTTPANIYTISFRAKASLRKLLGV